MHSNHFSILRQPTYCLALLFAFVHGSLRAQPTHPASVIIRASRVTLPIYQKLDVRVETARSYANPFDPNEVQVEAIFTSPTGKVSTVRGFWFQDFAIDHSSQSIRPKGPPSFSVRFTPTVVGRYRYTVLVTDKTGTSTSSIHELRATKALPGTQGFVRVHPTLTSRYYRDHSRASFFAIGFNADINTFYRPQNQGQCWDSTAGSRYFPSATAASGHQLDAKALYRNYQQFMEMMAKSAKAGANAMRLFNDAYYTPIEISPDMDVPGFGRNLPGFAIGRYHLGMCWLIDKLYETAERYGMVIRHTAWAGNANINWGGRQYAVAENEELMKRRLGYQLDRWGYSPSYWATTYFNELGQGDKTLPDGDTPFWRNLTAWLRQRDPYGHLISNNIHPYAGNVRAGGIDDYAPHYYANEVKTFADWQTDVAKPMIYEEYGGGHTLCKVPLSFDANADFPRMGIFQNLLGNRSGALTWWVKPYYGYLNLYEKMYRGIANFLKGENLIESGNWQRVIVDAEGNNFYAINAMATERLDRVFLYLIRTGPADTSVVASSERPIKLTLKKGRYRLEWWNPVTGEKTTVQSITIGPDQTATLNLPTSNSPDLAAKLIALP